MNKAPLLIEIGTEEMPPLKLLSFQTAWRTSFEQSLKSAQLEFSEIQTFVTPRRLAILIHDLSDTQPDQVIERKGPHLATAFDTAGNPTPATQGFLRGLNVTLADCHHQETPKGTFLYYRAIEPGQTLDRLIQGIVEQAIQVLPIPKPMRWNNHSYHFVRPVHWLVALHGHHILPLSLFGQTADRYTHGHRFHYPDPILLRDASEYETALYERFVIADHQKRQSSIVSQIHAIASMFVATAVIDPTVLEEVTGLVEWPVALSASFEPKFLKLPKEIPICSMQTHQRYFPLQNVEGSLIEHFIVISNIESTLPEVIKQGNERVVRARLSDAAYFYEQDCNHPLETRFDKLSQVVFQNQLGDYQSKTNRIMAIATTLAAQCSASINVVGRASHLAKCDLLTQMVCEFPELQGTMGYYYALHQKESIDVATAIAEHYKPRFAADHLPTSMHGVLLALADRLDTITGIFGIGLLPTGTKDPYALRRQAIAIIRLCVEKQLDLKLSDLISLSVKQYGSLLKAEPLSKLLPFFQERLKMWLQETYSISPDLIDAVMAVQPDHPLDILHRILALSLFKQRPEARHLAAAHKRVHNILAKNPAPDHPTVNPSLFESIAEKNLYEHLQKCDLSFLCSKPSDFQVNTKPRATAGYNAVLEDSDDSKGNTTENLRVKSSSYTTTLEQLATLQQPVDDFFTEVMVIAEDLKIRHNRLALLKQLEHLFGHVADLALLQS